METGESLSRWPTAGGRQCVPRGRPIADALGPARRIVITGRVADASLTLGPAAAHFGWAWDDWDRLAGASVAGHIIECGAQATGGLWHAGTSSPTSPASAIPIAEVAADGSCGDHQARGTGGLVASGPSPSRLVYEIDDPAHYHTPDVDVDFTTVALDQDGPRPGCGAGCDRAGRRGTGSRWPPSIAMAGPPAACSRWSDAMPRPRPARPGAMILERVRRAGFTLADSLVECLGAGDVVPGVLRPPRRPYEVVLRVTVRDPNRAAVERFCREFAPLVTSGPPGSPATPPAGPRPGRRSATGRLWSPAALVEPATSKVRHSVRNGARRRDQREIGASS